MSVGSSRSSIQIAIAIVAIAGCHRKPSKPIADTHPEPAGVVMTISADGTQLARLGEFLHAVKPGAEAAVRPMVATELARLTGATSLEGLELGGELDVIVVADAPSEGSASGVAVVGKIKDAGALTVGAGSAAQVETRDGWAIVGPPAVVTEVAPWALSTLRAIVRPSVPTATARVDHGVRRYADQLAATRAALHAQLVAKPDGASLADATDALLDGILALATDASEARVTLEIDGAGDATTAALDLAIVPTPSSRLAALVAAQQPSAFALLSTLPAADAGAIMLAGRMVAGPYRAGLLTLIGALFMSPERATAIDALMQASTGEAAGMWSRGAAGTAMTFAFGIADAAAAQHAIDALAHAVDGHAFTSGGMTTSYRALPAQSHDGVALRGYETVVDTSKAPGPVPTGTTTTRSYFAVLGDRGLAVSSGAADAEVVLARALDAAHGKASTYAPTPAFAHLLDDARTRGQALVALFDLVTIQWYLTGAQPAPATYPGRAPAMIALGFADHAAHVRLTIPASSLPLLLP